MRRDFTSPDDFLQDLLFDWLDESELAGEEANLANVVSLFGKLVRDGLFQYAKYVQRLVARGEPGLSYTQVRRPVLYTIFLLIWNALWL
jgi:mediator of RNA polymerase II transcription subunit 12